MKLVKVFLLMFFCSTQLIAESGFTRNYQGVRLKITEDATAKLYKVYASMYAPDKINVTKGMIVYGDTATHRYYFEDHGKELNRYKTGFKLNEYYVHNDEIFSLESKYVIPICNMQLPENWISKYDDTKLWVISYYLDILKSKNRETARKFEKNYIENIEEQARWDEYFLENWWEIFQEEMFESLIISPASICIGGFKECRFFIINIAPYNNGYKITLEGDSDFSEYEKEYNYTLPFPKYNSRRQFDFIFLPDGSFLDVYLDNTETLFASFAKVDRAVLTELNKLIETNECDISNIAWPQRSGGFSILNFNPTHITLDNLRIRSAPSLKSNTIAVVSKDGDVQVLEQGKEDTIDGVTAFWVRIINSGGITGWCFSGYLKAVVAVEKANQDIITTAGIAIETEKSLSENQNPPQLNILWIIIGLGTIIITAFVIIIIKRRKS